MSSFQFSVPQFFFQFNQINGILQQILISLKNQFSLYTYTVPQIKGLKADACECGNKLSGSVKCGEFLD